MINISNILYIESKSELILFLQDEANVIIIDNKVYNIYKDIFSNLNNKILPIEVKEEVKNLGTAEKIIEFLILNNVSKYNKILCVGGGVLSDIVGFVASIYKRGIEYNIIPTSLLSMVDASIGGKNSVNFLDVKNAIGTIYLPQNIGIYTEFCKTLERNSFISGICEIIKIAILFDNELLYKLKKIDDFNNISHEDLLYIIKKSIAHKLNIVSQDLYDESVRNMLNYGHTIGHVIESSNNFSIDHGIAVLIGMYIENDFLKQYNSYDYSEELLYFINKLGLEDLFKNLNLKNNINNIFHDKKAYNNLIKMVYFNNKHLPELRCYLLKDLIKFINEKY